MYLRGGGRGGGRHTSTSASGLLFLLPNSFPTDSLSHRLLPVPTFVSLPGLELHRPESCIKPWDGQVLGMRIRVHTKKWRRDDIRTITPLGLHQQSKELDLGARVAVSRTRGGEGRGGQRRTEAEREGEERRGDKRSGEGRRGGGRRGEEEIVRRVETREEKRGEGTTSAGTHARNLQQRRSFSTGVLCSPDERVKKFCLLVVESGLGWVATFL